MIDAPELQPVSHSAAVWQRYDRLAKADLWSTAIRTPTAVYLVDPIPVNWDSLADFCGDSPVHVVVVTNENHTRDAPSFCSRFSASLIDHSTSTPMPSGLAIISLPGAAAGEIAIVTSGGELVIGDALINFEPYGFAFLPDKYCTDPKLMRRSLRKLLDHEFDRIFFAHGTPITRDARRRLESLLASTTLST